MKTRIYAAPAVKGLTITKCCITLQQEPLLLITGHEGVCVNNYTIIQPLEINNLKEKK